MGLLATLCIGVGWVVGITVMMVFMPLSGRIDYSFSEAMGNAFVFGFPGLMMFMIAAILALNDDTGY